MEVQGTEEVISSLETFILLLTFSNEKYPYQLKLALKCTVELCEVRREYCETFVELLGSSLGKVDGTRYNKHKIEHKISSIGFR